MLQDYFQPADHSLEFASLAAGGDIALTLVDNSSDFTNAILKWSKLTIRPYWDAVDMGAATVDSRTLLMMVHKQDEDDTTAKVLDSQEVIRELQNDKKIIRGPWWYTPPGFVTSGFRPTMAGHMKPIVLKNFVMDREEDLRMDFTNISSSAFSATSQILKFGMRGFVRVIK